MTAIFIFSDYLVDAGIVLLLPWKETVLIFLMNGIIVSLRNVVSGYCSDRT